MRRVPRSGRVEFGRTGAAPTEQCAGFVRGVRINTLYIVFTGKEFDVETGFIYFGARYYDARLGRWTTVDPPLVKGEYLPKPSDFDNEHDMYWYSLNDKTNELPGMGGVFNPVNLNAYQYAGNNPVVLVDPDGNIIKVTHNGGVYILPFRSGTEATITSDYGIRNDPLTGETGFHTGVDAIPSYDFGNIATNRSLRRSTHIVAIADGKVEFAGWKKGYGKTVDILHGWDENGEKVITRYAHLNKIFVKEGEMVRRDQDIGYMGNTGRGKGEHLHYEMILKGRSRPIRNEDLKDFLWIKIIVGEKNE